MRISVSSVIRRACLLSGTTVQRPPSFLTSITEPLCAIISMRVCSAVCASALALVTESADLSLPASSAPVRLTQPGNISSGLVYSWFACRSPCSELSEPLGSGK
jgi:hypothetical protein